ncbi:MAG: DeoR/GlpR transcriptional regulator [Clostridia bacterium]|nr:DeoR/GlpR transcriptional regulator [Clostridia bacterium]
MRLDRLNAMEQYVLQNGTATLEDLAKHFSVSANTIRRDVNELLERDRIKKVYGGVSIKAAQSPLPISVRSSKCAAEKLIIGRLASTLVEDNSTIFLDSGSTTTTLLPNIVTRQQITMVTHSLPAMYEASKYEKLKVVALGGIYNAATSSYFGVSTIETLSRMTINTVFIAATGVSLERGLTNTTYLEAEIKRCITSREQCVVLMADHTKFGYSSMITFCDFEKLFAVVTDRLPPPPFLEVIQRKGIKLLCPETMPGSI